MTPYTLTSLADLHALPVDTVIDVRAPAEFAEDHIPGAINLPVLTDAQRAEVGTLYKQDSPFNARKIGGALVAQNTAAHLQGPLADMQGDWQPLVYCWRGGQRSGAFATILDQVGWRVQLLQGGYRSYRRLVVNALYDTPLAHRLIVIEGGTGTAKTALLAHLRKQGAQVLDLEAMAAHRGSLFGATGDTQPAQKAFESHLAAALAPLDPTAPTWVEAESSRIGQRTLPPSLWAAMQTAERVEISAPTEARAAYLSAAYADLTTNTARLINQINQLSAYHSADTIAHWLNLAKARDWTALAEGLITAHYDPRYTKSAARSAPAARRYALPDLEPNTLERAASQLMAEVS